MAAYQATRDFHLGATRTTLTKGAEIEVSGEMVTHNGKSYRVPGLEGIIAAGLLAPIEVSTALVPRTQETRPAPPRPTPPPPAHAQPDKPHVWEEDLFGNGGATCKVCGVSRTGGPNFGTIQVDRPSLAYKYTDAYGVGIESLTELPCPVFIGHMGGAVAGTTYRVRKLKGQVESIEDRLARLEAENEELRRQVARRQQIALGLLERLVVAAETLTTTPEAKALLLPDHGEIIDILATDEEVPVPVERVRVLDSEPS